MKIEDLDVILEHQLFPLEAHRYLKHIASKIAISGISLALKEAYCLGIIDGKRLERMKRKRI
jgi:hypothetical protein